MRPRAQRAPGRGRPRGLYGRSGGRMMRGARRVGRVLGRGGRRKRRAPTAPRDILMNKVCVPQVPTAPREILMKASSSVVLAMPQSLDMVGER